MGSARNGPSSIATTRPRMAVRAFLADPATTAPITTASATPARAGFTGGSSWDAGGQLRMRRRGQDAEDVDRPVAEPGPADDMRDGHRPERAGVSRVRPVIA